MQAYTAQPFSMNNIEAIKKFCEEYSCRYIENEPLRDHLTFRVGGPCAVMLFPASETVLVESVKTVRAGGLPYYIIGNGSNLIARDEGYDGVIINTSSMAGAEVSGTGITAPAGASLMSICRLALDNSLSGLEFAFGIPGTVGGAVYMNAGAYGGEMKDVLSSVRYPDTDLSIKEAPVSELGLGYRHSMYSGSDKIILSASFTLAVGDKADIKAKMDDLMGRRRDKQPLEFPSAGSTFKRPKDNYAGALIEKCALKGYTVGGVCVSEKHAGFVINKGGATAADILAVVEHCRSKVLEDTGITLEPEVRIIG